MTQCDRCYGDASVGEHGHLKCPLEPRRANSVITDEIPGGVEIRHGLCGPGGVPRRYYSKSEIEREAKKRGLTPFVQHVPQRGSDKSPHTTRWI